MKKRMAGGLLAVCMFALAGCGGASENVASAEEYVQKAHQMLEEADSFTATFAATVQMKGAGKTVTEGTVAVVKDPLYMNVDTTLTFDNLVQKYDMYLEKTEDGVNQYMNYDGEWTEMNMSEEDALTSTHLYHTLYNMETIFSAGENWTAERDGGKIRLQGVIPESKFYDVEEYTRWFQLAGMSGLSEVYYTGIGDVPVTVMLDSKTGAPLSYEADLAKPLEIMTNNVLTELGGGKLENGVAVESYQITSELTQLGGVEAEEIPAEAKDTAINYEKEISLLESEN
ncbi:LolA family protein [Anaerotignum sp.]